MTPLLITVPAWAREADSGDLEVLVRRDAGGVTADVRAVRNGIWMPVAVVEEFDQ